MNLENNTRKQTWAVLVAALVAWLYAGWVLCLPGVDGLRPIANVAVLAAYFGTIIGVILPVILSAYKSNSDQAIKASVEIAKANCPPAQ